MFRFTITILLLAFPWSIRRWLLCKIFGYQIDKTARIGLSIILPKKLIMGKGASIGHLSLCKGADLLEMQDFSCIGNLNWITGLSTIEGSDFFKNDVMRKSELTLGVHSAITNRHLIDCTDSVSIGEFTTFAGFRSQILTHSIDIRENRQVSEPVSIGRYCFIGTGSIFIKGSAMPDYAVLGAGSLVNKKHTSEYTLYGGVPARILKELPKDYAYFNRSTGFAT